jgi:methylmalonyl-CoA/ethylmalonyl-CoA epimerase
MSRQLDLGPLRQVSQHAGDLDRAAKFYEDVLGLRLIARYDRLAFFDMGGVRLFLQQLTGDARQTGSVLYFGVDDVHAARIELEARGVVFVDSPHVVHHDEEGVFGPAPGDEWMTFFRDSEDNLLGLSSRQAPGRAS